MSVKMSYLGNIDNIIDLFLNKECPIAYGNGNYVTEIKLSAPGDITFTTTDGKTVTTTIGKKYSSKAKTIDGIFVVLVKRKDGDFATLRAINPKISSEIGELKMMEYILRHYTVRYKLPDNSGFYIKVTRVVRENNNRLTVYYEEKTPKKIISGAMELIEGSFGKVTKHRMYFDNKINCFIIENMS